MPTNRIDTPVIFNATLHALMLRKPYKSNVSSELLSITIEINGIQYVSYNTENDEFTYDGRLTITFPHINIVDNMVVRLKFEDEYGNTSDWSDFYLISTSNNKFSVTTTNIDNIPKLNSIDVYATDNSNNRDTYTKLEIEDNTSKHHMSMNSNLYQYPEGNLLLSTKLFTDIIPEHVDGEQTYRLRENDLQRFDRISYKFYGTPELWWVIMAVNNIIDPFNQPYENMILRILPLSYVEYALLRYNIQTI